MKSLFSPLAAMFLAVAQSAWAAAPVEGSVAPDFSLPDASGKERRLADWRGRWLVLYFYPKDDTPGCTTEARNFRDRLERFAAQKAEVVGVSLDDGASHRAFADKHRLPFTLLSDAGGTVAKRYGALSDFGVFRFAKRYTFLIDPEGRIARAYLKVDAEGHAEEVLADIRRLGGA
ncbi:MAG: peroxiredoxin [Dechloromonas sp.]|jgi:peroxiredoxin Q/BCP|nr:peroxiredoxin [Dechloromonas sp.]